MNNGEVAIIDSTTVEITELPIKTWTQVCEVCFYTFFREFIHDFLSDSGFFLYIYISFFMAIWYVASSGWKYSVDMINW